MVKKKMLSLVVSPLLLATLVLQPVSVAASVSKDSENPLQARTQISTSSVSLSWEHFGNNYQIFRDGKLIAETKQNAFTDTDVKPDELVKYVIAAFDDDKLVETIRISTKANSISEMRTFSGADKAPDMTIESVAGANFITLNWPEIPDDDGVYSLYKDGEFIATVSERKFTDKDVEPNSTYRYSVIGTKKLSESEVENIKTELGDAIDVSDDELYALENTYEAIKFVKTLDSNLDRNLDEDRLAEANLITLASAPYFSFRYLTFIPDYKVKNPFDLSGDSYFLGNDRGFNVLTFNNSKTEQNIDVEFDQPNSSTYNHRVGVDTTVLVDEDNTEINRKTATCSTSNGGFDLFLYTPHSFGADAKKFAAGADCGIPYFDNISPDITYGYDAWIERDGDWRVAGSHDKAPSHEFYIYSRDTGTYEEIFQHSALRKSNGDVEFNALFPWWASTHFDISG